jgi:hypothetical protein
MPHEAPADPVIARTKTWVERAVIGLNLCPFAKAEHAHGRIRYVVSQATSEAGLLEDLQRELLHLVDADPAQCETTLLIHPQVLADFLDYNDFLDLADALVEDLELDGTLQVASFHPQYQFAATAADDITNCTNRAPYPTLHLLREASVAKAVASFPDASEIFERNQRTLRELGHEGWQRVMGAGPDG